MTLPDPGGVLENIPQLAGGEQYHAFIAHCSKDKDFSYEVANGLKKLGFKCMHADDDFVPGKSVVANIEEGITHSRRVVVLISEHFLNSMWFTFEVASSLTKSYEKHHRVLIPVLYNVEPSKVPSYVREINYIQTTEKGFWQKLTRALVENIPISAAIPAGNVAYGLAWSYYYGYLSIILPGLAERISNFKKRPEPKKFDSNIPFVENLCIVLPESGYCPGDIGQCDSNMEYIDKIPFQAARAGNKERPYPSSVYRIKDPDTKREYLTVLEFATPLMSMFEMEQGMIAGLGPDARLHQMMLFEETLSTILKHPSNKVCHDTVILLKYGDMGKETEILSAKIAHRLQQQLDLNVARQELEQNTI